MNVRQTGIRAVSVILLTCLALVACAREPLPNTSGDGDRTVPQLSPDRRYLLGHQNGIFSLTQFPGNDLVLAFPVQESQTVEDFIWSPQSDVFAYHTRHNEPWGSCGVYIVNLDGSLEKVADLEPPNLGSRQMLWSLCGRYLFWDKPFSIYDREAGTVMVKSDIDRDHAFVRSPLFSRDGSKIAFTLFESHGPENLWFVDLGNGSVRQVTSEGEGDYPFFWMDDTKVLVRIGAVSTGGGNVYGLAAIDVETGSRVLMDDPSNNGFDSPGLRRLNLVKGISPDGDHLLGESRSAAGTESRIYLFEPGTGHREIILEGETSGEGYGLVQCLWTQWNQVLLNVRKELYDGVDRDSQDCYQILQYSPGSECHPLVEGSTEMSLLGVVDNRLYYLALGEREPLRSVELKSLD